MKRLLVLIIVLTLQLTTSLHVYAEGIDEMPESSYSPLQFLNETEYFELEKQLGYWLQSNPYQIANKTGRFYTGEPIICYELINSSIIASSISYLPIYYNEDLICFAILIDSIDATPCKQIQLTDCWIDELSACTRNDPIALLFDNRSCYLISCNEIQLLHVNSIFVDSRGSLQDLADIDLSTLELNILHPCCELGFHISDPSRYSISLPVAYVPQVYQHICWAASSACIGNYLTSYNYTAQQIAQSIYGPFYNNAASLAVTLYALNNNYYLNYSIWYDHVVPNDATIYYNLSTGYPMYGSWASPYSSSTNIYHYTVICGIFSGSYLYVMDPEYGFTMAYWGSSGYSYLSPVNNVQLTLEGYASML